MLTSLTKSAKGFQHLRKDIAEFFSLGDILSLKTLLRQPCLKTPKEKEIFGTTS
jgi:hypothetical protein